MSLDKLLTESKTNYKVYTPENIAREIVAKALSFYFTSNKKKKLLKLRATDLACGNGNLLIILIESLIKIHKIYFGYYDYKEDWVEGYDLDKNALLEFEQRANELFAKYKLNKKVKLFNQDSLSINFEKSYNIIIGNPPYLGEKNNREIFEKLKETDFGKKHYQGKMDFLYFFILKGLELLDKDGSLCYITTNYWLKADGASKLRESIKNQSYFSYINNINKSVFKDAIGQHNIVFALQKKRIKEALVINEKEKFRISDKFLYEKTGKISLLSPEDFEFCKKLKKIAKFSLGEKFNVNQGIVSGHDKAFVFDKYKEEFSEFLKPFYKNKDIHKYRISKALYYILYLDGKKNPNEKLITYLKNYKEKLESRREVQKNRINWWELQWSRDEKIFHDIKIVGRQRNRRNDFALVSDEFYASADVYYITPKDTKINMYYILAYLNSEVFYRWFKLQGKNKGEFLELYSTPLKEVPIIYENDKIILEKVENLIKRQMESFSKEIQKEIDEYFTSKIKD